MSSKMTFEVEDSECYQAVKVLGKEIRPINNSCFITELYRVLLSIKRRSRPLLVRQPN